MADWKTVRYGDVTTNVRTRAGANADDEQLLSVTAANGVIGQMHSGRRDISAADKSKYLVVEPGDVVYNTMRMWQGVSGFSEMRGIVSPAYTVLRPSEHALDGRFLAYLMKLVRNINVYRAYSQGLVSDTWNLKFGVLSNLELEIPPLEEQQRIAEVLDTIDEVIQTTECIISKRKALRSGLAAELLAGDANISALTNSDLSEIWRSYQSLLSTKDGIRNKRLPHLLLDVASSTVDGPFGSALKTEHYIQGPGVRVVRLTNLGDGQFVDKDQVFVDKDYANALSRHEVRGGDVLVAALGDDNHRPGRACLYPIELEPGIVKADCFRIRSSNLIDSRYLREALNSSDVVHQVSRLAQGVTRNRINLSQLRRIVLRIPPLQEQQWIAEVLDTIDETIQGDEEKLVKLQQLRTGLADDLLSGRVRTVAA